MMTQTQLKQLLNYDHETGIFTWLVSSAVRIKVGSVAGNIEGKSNGYVQIVIRGKSYKAHRLAWLYIFDKFPENMIDHINGIRSDNRIFNLRDVTRSENSQNQKKSQLGSASNLLGVTWHKCQWRARVMLNGKDIHIGYFDCKYKAYNAYLNRKRMIHAACEI